MKGLTFILLLCLFSLVYTQIIRLESNKPARKPSPIPRITSRPTNTARPSRTTNTARPSPLPSGERKPQDCKKRKFIRKRVCGESKGIYSCMYIMCPKLSCTERGFFKTAAEIGNLAIKAGAAVTSSRTDRPARRHATENRQSTIGCRNYMYHCTDATSIRDHVTGVRYNLAIIPAGCDGREPFHQIVFYNGCWNDYCCSGAGHCNPKTVSLPYLDAGFKPIRVEQVLFCDCENVQTPFIPIWHG